jgi:NADPH:quinone reductase-like Zn-dependent oxidoreductase
MVAIPCTCSTCKRHAWPSLLLGCCNVHLRRDVAYRGFWLVPWLEAKPASEQRAVVEKTVKLLADKVMDPPVGKVFPLADFAAAVEESQQTGRIGKVLLKMD